MMKWVSLLLVLVPNAVWACPVCGTAPARSQAAYVWMTAMMTLLPLAVIGTLVFLLFRRLRAHEPPRRDPVAAASVEPVVLADSTLP
jgi:hypothetical protein